MANLENQIYLSRDEIRNQIINYLQEYLELENIDLTKSSFLSFIVNIMSTLTSNLMFYQSSIYKEFFLTKAQLPSSILNLSSFLGYKPAKAFAAKADVLLSIPLTFQENDVEFVLPKYSTFSTSDGIKFLTNYITKVTVTNNSDVKVYTTDDRGTKEVSTYIDSGSKTFNFLLPLQQLKFSKQEFQIPEDTPKYQFVSIDVVFSDTDQVAEMDVKIIPPGSAEGTFEVYSEYDSIYLMTSNDKGYVRRKRAEGYTLNFGNGIIGVQPPPGCKIIVETYLTNGKIGNVISGSIAKGDAIYVQNSLGATESVTYDVINPSPATGGIDEESIEDTRNNAITSLTTLNRLVSKNDYMNLDVVSKGFPISVNSMPVLKRSDVKINEIQIFSAFNFASNIVPTRNAYLVIPGEQLYVPRNTTIGIDGVDYITLFDMYVDKLNQSTYYKYILYDVEFIPTFEASYNETYNVQLSNIKIYKDGDKGIFKLNYTTFQPDNEELSCDIEMGILNIQYDMVHDPIEKTFTFTLDPYTLLPENDQKYYFTVRHNNLGLICQYSVHITFRKNLNDLMVSNTFVDSSDVPCPDETIIYDIPVVQKSYYDNVDQKTFELQILQTMLDSLNFKRNKMLTDFVNLKFMNTTGIARNMSLNKHTRLPVLDHNMIAIPNEPNEGDRYIISGNEHFAWEGRKDQIATCTDSTNSLWVYTVPVMDDIIYIDSEETCFVYSESGWVSTKFDIPLKIKLDILKDFNYDGAAEQLKQKIRDTLYDKFNSRFGANASIYRSEIIKEVQSIEGIDHCKLIEPKSNIFYNFNINDFAEKDLLNYTPEYVFFVKDEIEINILNSN